MGESGEFKRGTLGESKESYKVKTYGRVVAIIGVAVEAVASGAGDTIGRVRLNAAF